MSCRSAAGAVRQRRAMLLSGGGPAVGAQRRAGTSRSGTALPSQLVFNLGLRAHTVATAAERERAVRSAP
jgi:hypothetical protein